MTTTIFRRIQQFLCRNVVPHNVTCAPVRRRRQARPANAEWLEHRRLPATLELVSALYSIEVSAGSTTNFKEESARVSTSAVAEAEYTYTYDGKQQTGTTSFYVFGAAGRSGITLNSLWRRAHHAALNGTAYSAVGTLEATYRVVSEPSDVESSFVVGVGGSISQGLLDPIEEVGHPNRTSEPTREELGVVTSGTIRVRGQTLFSDAAGEITENISFVAAAGSTFSIEASLSSAGTFTSADDVAHWDFIDVLSVHKHVRSKGDIGIKYSPPRITERGVEFTTQQRFTGLTEIDRPEVEFYWASGPDESDRMVTPAASTRISVQRDRAFHDISKEQFSSWLPHTVPGSDRPVTHLQIVLDPQNEFDESNERNNNYALPIPQLSIQTTNEATIASEQDASFPITSEFTFSLGQAGDDLRGVLSPFDSTFVFPARNEDGSDHSILLAGQHAEPFAVYARQVDNIISGDRIPADGLTGTWSQVSMSSQTGTGTFTLPLIGTYEVQGRIRQNTGGDPRWLLTPSTLVEVRLPTYEELMDDYYDDERNQKGLKRILDDEWQATKGSAAAARTDIVERGGWIQFTTRPRLGSDTYIYTEQVREAFGKYAFRPFEHSGNSSVGENRTTLESNLTELRDGGFEYTPAGGITPDDKPESVEQQLLLAASYGTYIVSIFHTHGPTTYVAKELNHRTDVLARGYREVGASCADNEIADKAGVVGIVYDYEPDSVTTSTFGVGITSEDVSNGFGLLRFDHPVNSDARPMEVVPPPRCILPPVVTRADVDEQGRAHFQWTRPEGATIFIVAISEHPSDATKSDVLDPLPVLGQEYVSNRLDPGDYTFSVIAKGPKGTSTPATRDFMVAGVTDLPGGRPQPGVRAKITNEEATVIEWDVVPGAVSYDLWLDDLTAGEREVIHSTILTGREYEIPALLPDGEYGVYLRAINSDGLASNWSDLLRFSVGVMPPPDVPELTADSIETEDRTPTLAWNSVRNAERYDLWIDNLSTGERQIIRRTDLTGTSFTPGAPLEDGAYRAFVRSVNDEDTASVWSEKVEFRVRDVVLSPPVIVSPGPTTQEMRPEISWEPVDGAASYWLFIADLQQRRWADSATVETGTSFRPDKDLEPGHYKVVVHARDENGSWSRLSVRHFTVEGDTPRPDGPILLSPENVTTDRTPGFEWQAVEHAVKYSLQIDNRSTGESSVVRAEDLTSTSYQVEENLPLGRYRVEVLAWNADGVSSVTNEMVTDASRQLYEFSIEHPAPPYDEPVSETGGTEAAVPIEPAQVVLADRVLTVTGSPQDDLVMVATVGSQITVDANGTVSEFAEADVDRLQFFGDAGSDVFENRTVLPALLDGQAGNDSLQGGSARDTLLGGAGDDLLIGHHGRDWIDGGEGNDKALGAAHDDTLIGGLGNDFLDGQGSSHDVLIVTGSDAADDITLRRSGAYTAIDSTGGATFSARFRRAEHITLNTRGGNDAVTAIGIGNAGYFRLRTHLGDGDDSLDFSKAENAQVISIALGGTGQDTLIGGPGRDRFNGGTGNSIQIGNSGHDTLVGGEGNDQLNGGDGQDRLRGFGGQDTLSGGGDRDWLYGGDGDDELDGGDGRDRLQGEAGHDVLRGGPGRDTLLGGTGNDSLDGGQSHDALSGSAGHDLLIGSSGHDTLHGADGDDSLYGGTGNDILLGGEGDDAGSGQRGDDTVSTGAGMDAIAASTREIDEAFKFDAWWLQVV